MSDYSAYHIIITLYKMLTLTDENFPTLVAAVECNYSLLARIKNITGKFLMEFAKKIDPNSIGKLNLEDNFYENYMDNYLKFYSKVTSVYVEKYGMRVNVIDGADYLRSLKYHETLIEKLKLEDRQNTYFAKYFYGYNYIPRDYDSDDNSYDDSCDHRCEFCSEYGWYVTTGSKCKILLVFDTCPDKRLDYTRVKYDKPSIYIDDSTQITVVINNMKRILTSIILNGGMNHYIYSDKDDRYWSPTVFYKKRFGTLPDQLLEFYNVTNVYSIHIYKDAEIVLANDPKFYWVCTTILGVHEKLAERTRMTAMACKILWNISDYDVHFIYNIPID